MTTMTPRERIELQVSIYKDLVRDDRRLIAAYEDLVVDASGWRAERCAAAKARITVYESAIKDLEEILKDWVEEGDDRK